MLTATDSLAWQSNITELCQIMPYICPYVPAPYLVYPGLICYNRANNMLNMPFCGDPLPPWLMTNQVLPGQLVSAEPELRLVELDPSLDRFVVLACDGIWDVLQAAGG